MLVLSRQVGESIKIGSDVTITVLNVRGNHIRIGICAPREVAVHRQEVYLRSYQSQTSKVSHHLPQTSKSAHQPKPEST